MKADLMSTLDGYHLSILLTHEDIELLASGSIIVIPTPVPELTIETIILGNIEVISKATITVPKDLQETTGVVVLESEALETARKITGVLVTLRMRDQLAITISIVPDAKAADLVQHYVLDINRSAQQRRKLFSAVPSLN